MSKDRKNITISKHSEDLGKLLAKEDKRSFSAQVAWLIEQESKRRGLDGSSETADPTTTEQEAA